MTLIAHHSQQQGSADIQIGSPSKKQRINHQHGRQQPGHSTTPPGIQKRSQGIQTKTVALLVVFFGLLDELHENINVGMQITSLRAIAHTS